MLLVNADSQLIVKQIKGEYETKDTKMDAYLDKFVECISDLEAFNMKQIPRVENVHVDSLVRLASSFHYELPIVIPV